MATRQKQGRVVLRGRFKPGTDVRLVEVEGDGVMRSQGGREVGSATVGEDGVVSFDSGVHVGGRYFVVGNIDGQPVEVRMRGNEKDDDETILGQEPVQKDEGRTRAGLPAHAIQGEREDETIRVEARRDDLTEVPDVLAGEQLAARAEELGVDGKGMSDDALRESVREAESKQAEGS